MVSSKPRSGSSEISQKTPSATKSKASSPSKNTRGTPSSSEIDSKSSRLLEQRPSKVTNLTKKRVDVRELEMQRQMSHLQEELKKAKEQLASVEEERDQTADELRKMKKISEVTNMRLNEALSARTQACETPRVEESVRQELVVALEAKEAALTMANEARNTSEANAKRILDLSSELDYVKKSLVDSNGELEIKEKNIESLKLELEKAKQIKAELAEKEASLEELKRELSNTRASETRTMGFLSESKLRVQTLEAEVEKAKASETQMKQLEQTNLLLEEAKLEISSLEKKVASLEDLVGESSRDLDASHRCLEKAKLDTHSVEKSVEILKSELLVAKEGLTRAQEGEKIASSRADSLTQEMSLIKSELDLATEAEEKSKRAMDDLALVLIEVTTETNEMKDKLSLTQSELEKYQGLLEEARKEIDRVKSVAERLNLESEDSILAWNEKELEFVNCIKRAEEESTALELENNRLIMSLRMSEDIATVTREENCKLRDLLKQALNEASVAKEASEITRAENSQLKDSLLDKDDVLRSLTQENECLRINEAAALENVKELKRLLPTTSSEAKVLNLKFEEVKIPNEHKDEDEDLEKAEVLKGSIFDMVDSPEPVCHHRKAPSSIFTDDGETINIDDFDHLDGTQFDFSENGKSSQRRKKALLRRFGDLLMKRSFHKREPTAG